MPQARFWIAMASENSLLSQPNSSAIGIWNTPKDERTAKLSMMMMHPVIRTGVKSEAERGIWVSKKVLHRLMAGRSASNQEFCGCG